MWTGSLAQGEVVTISGSMTVNNPDRGNKTLTLVATSAAAGSTCVVGTSPNCTTSVQVKVPQLTMTSAADTSSTLPESVVAYTFSLTNTGQTAYVGANAVVTLVDTLDDATYNGDATATGGQRRLHQSDAHLDGRPRDRGQRQRHLLGHREQPRSR